MYSYLCCVLMMLANQNCAFIVFQHFKSQEKLETMLMKKFGGQTKSNVRPTITCMLIGCPFMFRFHCYLRFCTPSFAVLVLYLFLLLSLYCHLHPFIAFHSSTYLHIVFVAYVSPKLCMYHSFFGLLPSLFVALVAVSSY